MVVVLISVSGCKTTYVEDSKNKEQNTVIGTKEDETELCVSCDGEPPVSIGAGCSVVVQKAELAADFIRIKSDSFIEILNSKMLHP